MTGDPEGPRDPFADEAGGPWHVSLRHGAMVLEGLREIDNVVDAVSLIKKLPREDLECVVLERLYVFHAQKPPRSDGFAIDRWLQPPDYQ